MRTQNKKANEQASAAVPARKPYPSDLTDGQWEQIKSLIPKAKPGGRERTADMREILNGAFYVVKSGCDWRMLPHDLPNWKTVYYYFSTWKKDGSWKKIHEALRDKVRLKAGKKKQPTAGIIDSQSVKTAEKGGFVGMMLVRK